MEVLYFPSSVTDTVDRLHFEFSFQNNESVSNTIKLHLSEKHEGGRLMHNSFRYSPDSIVLYKLAK